MELIRCGFRRHVRSGPDGETAQCDLLRRLIDDRDGDRSRVHRSACMHCGGDRATRPTGMIDVIGSAVLADRGHGSDNDSSDALRQLAQRTVHVQSDSRIASSSKRLGPPAAVDVVMPIRRADASTATVIEGWLRQRHTHLVLHLVGDSETAIASLKERMPSLTDDPRIRFWHHVFANDDLIRNAFAATHRVTQHLETPFLAMGCEHAVPIPDHLAIATTRLQREPAGWFAASSDRMSARCPRPGTWQRCVPLESVVMRRILWVDLNGGCDDAFDVDIDFFQRAVLEDHPCRIDDGKTPHFTSVRDEHDRVTLPSSSPSPPWHAGDLHAGDFAGGRFTWYRHGRGFAMPRLACDVILPFRGQLDWVAEAINSVLQQQGIDFTLHLVDDATPGDIDDWLRRYRHDPRIQIYRNSTNIGQFSSFNNASKYCQTDWLVTHDGDDVSLPGRLRQTVEIAALCDADLLGAASTLIGSDAAVESMQHVAVPHGDRTTFHRRSFQPGAVSSWYFLENPTVVHKRTHFHSLNGFADFGTVARNRTTLDTEWMMRSMMNGANIVACERLAVGYRIHDQSAINHPQTRMGSPIRRWAHQELTRRLKMLSQGGVPASTLGSLHRHNHITERWEG